ncbi:MAG: 1-deoxy-D-xylulose-5-phosphate reductoisomerase [Burkholderiaceae bacterium]
MKRLAILGSTGSIGMSTIDVVLRHPDLYAVDALVAHRNHQRMHEQCLQVRPAFAVMTDPQAAQALRASLSASDCRTEVLDGEAAAATVCAEPRIDTVMAAIVGAAGLAPTLAAAASGKCILLANKEAIVMAGPVFLRAVREGGARVLPIDSEHNAVFQCMPAQGHARGVRRIVLTASGGPFRTWSADQMRSVTPEQAVAHPNWSMGRKISVDSASMMNKGLELIEAHFLFGVPEPQLDVIVHPQSIIHSMVEYIDGSTLAQLGNPDMRTPIAHALAWPERIESGVNLLDLAAQGRLDFELPDEARFPCLGLAREALKAGDAAPCVLNAANEIAVEAFLAGRIGFLQIAQINAQVLEALGSEPAPAQVADVLALDEQARQRAHLEISRRGHA